VTRGHAHFRITRGLALAVAPISCGHLALHSIGMHVSRTVNDDGDASDGSGIGHSALGRRPGRRAQTYRR
jgi:hypothetical protein